MEGHQKSFVPPDLCVKVEVLCIFLWWGLMMFIRFFMGFANQKLSTTAVVGPWPFHSFIPDIRRVAQKWGD